MHPDLIVKTAAQPLKGYFHYAHAVKKNIRNIKPCNVCINTYISSIDYY